MSIPCVQSFDDLLQRLQQSAQQAAQLVAIEQPSLDSSDVRLHSLSALLQEIEASMKEAEQRVITEEQSLNQMHSSLLPSLHALQGELVSASESAARDSLAFEEALQEIVKEEKSIEPVMPAMPLANRSTNIPEQPRSAKKKASGSTKAKESSSSAQQQENVISPTMPASSGKFSVDRIRLPHLTAEEFDTIPKYIRGRLELARMNGAIDQMAGLFREKYSLLNHKGSLKSLNESQLTKFQAWSDEEAATDDTTRDNFFVSAEDLRTASELQALGSINLKAVLHTLRHMGRIKNSTSAGAPKYILVL